MNKKERDDIISEVEWIDEHSHFTPWKEAKKELGFE